MLLTDDELARLFARIEIAPSGCWEWQGAKISTGYGEAGSSCHATTPDGRRDCRACWKRENALACARRRASRPSCAFANRTHCPQGHPYDEANTYVDKRGFRYCRACSRERMRERRAKALACLRG